jgi:hypothetical protein
MSKLTHTLRDGQAYAAEERGRVDDVKIQQKIMAVNREAFVQRFPGQLEHHMRLVSERLQWSLTKPESCRLDDVTTWPAQPDEIMSLAHALRSLNDIAKDWPIRD